MGETKVSRRTKSCKRSVCELVPEVATDACEKEKDRSDDGRPRLESMEETVE